MATEQIHIETAPSTRKKLALSQSTGFLLALIVVGLVAATVAAVGVVAQAGWLTVLAGIVTAVLTVTLVFHNQLGE